jgi:alpha-ribazole phosphatase
MRLYLVRHGDTGALERYYGATDIPLSPQGQEQAERLRDRLSGEKIALVYSSDLQRALNTARVVASAHGQEPLPCPDLREVDFGEYEGLTLSEIAQRDPRAPQSWRVRGYRFPSGSSLDEVGQRVSAFSARLEAERNEGVLVVAHSGSLRRLLCHLLGLGREAWWHIRLDAASLSLLEMKPQGTALFLLNDTRHLRDGLHGKTRGQR